MPCCLTALQSRALAGFLYPVEPPLGHAIRLQCLPEVTDLRPPPGLPVKAPGKLLLYEEAFVWEFLLARCKIRGIESAS